MSTNAVTTFLAQLRKAQILEEPQLAEADRLGQTAGRPAEVAAELVKRGWITPYQANQVARGRGGELVLGSYVLLEPLGSGGMGQVVKARHRYLHRQVALKFIRRDQRDSADTVQRFQREVRLLAELRHLHIVQAHDAGNIGDTWFLAMELLDGIDLDRLVRQRGPLPVGQACACIRQAALGLAHAHERGLVHRDIKPSNLLLTSEGIKVLDLGLARLQAVSDENRPGDLTRANTVMGTPDYLAPEQALDPRRADSRSDLYSLGCTLYCLLIGRPPFPEGTLAQKLLYHQTVEPPAVATLRRDVPLPLADLIRRLLAKSPAQRPASAAEVAMELAPLATTVGFEAAAAVEPKAHGSAPAPIAKGPGLSGSSLVNARADAPERGFTLPTESMPPAPASLVNARADAPERGFTLLTESIPPTSTSSWSRANAGAQQGKSAATTHEQSPAPRRVALRRSALVAGLVLLLLVVGVGLMAGRFFSGPDQAERPAIAANQDKPALQEMPKTKQPEQPREPKVEKKRLGPKPPPLVAIAPKETEGLLLMATIAPDARLTKLKPGDTVFLSDLNEFAFKTTPLNWKFAKQGRVGDPKDPNSMIRVNGTTYPKGLGMHPPNTDYIRVCYALGKRGMSLHGSVALDDGDDPPWDLKTTSFVVLGDGKVLWRSQGIRDRGVIEPFTVDVRDVAVLELRVYTDYAGANGSRAVWLDPHVVRDDD